MQGGKLMEQNEMTLEFKAISKRNSQDLRNKQSEFLTEEKYSELLKEKYAQRLAILNRILEHDSLSDEDRSKYEKDKAEIEQLLNNDDNMVGDIVENEEVVEN